MKKMNFQNLKIIILITFIIGNSNSQLEDPEIFKIQFLDDSNKQNNTIKQKLFQKKFKQIPFALIGFRHIEIQYKSTIDFNVKISSLQQNRVTLSLTKNNDTQIVRVEPSILIIPRTESIYIHELIFDDIQLKMDSSYKYKKQFSYKTTAQVDSSNVQVQCFLTGFKAKVEEAQNFFGDNYINIQTSQSQTSFEVILDRLVQNSVVQSVYCNCIEIDQLTSEFQKVQILNTIKTKKEVYVEETIDTSKFYGKEVLLLGINGFGMKQKQNNNMQLYYRNIEYNSEFTFKAQAFSNFSELEFSQCSLIIISNQPCNNSDQSQCQFKCTQGYYLKINASLSQCFQCSYKCSRCQNTETQCIETCDPGQYKYESECYFYQPPNCYCDQQNQCVQCQNSKCYSCQTDLINCVDCPLSKYLFNSNCFDQQPKQTICKPKQFPY